MGFSPCQIDRYIVLRYKDARREDRHRDPMSFIQAGSLLIAQQGATSPIKPSSVVRYSRNGGQNPQLHVLQVSPLGCSVFMVCSNALSGFKRYKQCECSSSHEKAFLAGNSQEDRSPHWVKPSTAISGTRYANWRQATRALRDAVADCMCGYSLEMVKVTGDEMGVVDSLDASYLPER